MKADFLPGLELEEKGIHTADTLASPLQPVDRVTSNPDLYDRRWDAFTFRVKQFTCSLSRAQREAIARRPRFHSMPFLRRADEIDLDDVLP